MIRGRLSKIAGKPVSAASYPEDERAQRLVEQWLEGTLRTAVCYRADGSWCGSMSVEGPDAEPQLRGFVSHLLDFAPARIELRSPACKDWEEIAIPPDWLVPPPKHSPRLP